MKISVITLHTVKNYGSVLQAYTAWREMAGKGTSLEVRLCSRSSVSLCPCTGSKNT